jgi:hypothetical protein
MLNGFLHTTTEVIRMMGRLALESKMASQNQSSGDCRRLVRGIVPDSKFGFLNLRLEEY